MADHRFIGVLVSAGCLSACVLPGEEGLCIIERPFQVEGIVATEGCTIISVVTDELENLDGFRGLSHPADVNLSSASVENVDGLPNLDGQFAIVEVTALAEVDVTTSDGLTISDESVERARWRFLDAPLSAEAEVEPGPLRAVGFLEDIDVVELESDVECEIRFLLQGQSGVLDMNVDPTIRIRLSISESTFDDVAILQQIPALQLNSVGFGAMDPATFDVLRAYRDWLLSEGYAGPMNFPDGV